jgi:hypothetical protein
MLQRLGSDPLWVREYEEFVAAVSFGDTGSKIVFAAAFDACSRLVAHATAKFNS